MKNSDWFKDPKKHVNPNVPFPFSNKKKEALDVNMGLFFLKRSTFSQLGETTKKPYIFDQEMLP